MAALVERAGWDVTGQGCNIGVYWFRSECMMMMVYLAPASILLFLLSLLLDDPLMFGHTSACGDQLEQALSIA